MAEESKKGSGYRYTEMAKRKKDPRRSGVTGFMDFASPAGMATHFLEHEVFDPTMQSERNVRMAEFPGRTGETVMRQPWVNADHHPDQNAMRMARISRANDEAMAREAMRNEFPEIEDWLRGSPEFLAAYVIKSAAEEGDDKRGLYPEFYDPQSAFYRGSLFEGEDAQTRRAAWGDTFAEYQSGQVPDAVRALGQFVPEERIADMAETPLKRQKAEEQRQKRALDPYLGVPQLRETLPQSKLDPLTPQYWQKGQATAPPGYQHPVQRPEEEADIEPIPNIPVDTDPAEMMVPTEETGLDWDWEPSDELDDQIEASDSIPLTPSEIKAFREYSDWVTSEEDESGAFVPNKEQADDYFDAWVSAPSMVRMDLYGDRTSSARSTVERWLIRMGPRATTGFPKNLTAQIRKGPPEQVRSLPTGPLAHLRDPFSRPPGAPPLATEEPGSRLAEMLQQTIPKEDLNRPGATAMEDGPNIAAANAHLAKLQQAKVPGPPSDLPQDLAAQQAAEAQASGAHQDLRRKAEELAAQRYNRQQAPALRGDPQSLTDRILAAGTERGPAGDVEYDLRGRSSTENIGQLLDAQQKLYTKSASERTELLGLQNKIARDKARIKNEEARVHRDLQKNTVRAKRQEQLAHSQLVKDRDKKNKVVLGHLNELEASLKGTPEKPGALDQLDTFKGGEIDPWGEFTPIWKAVSAILAVTANTALTIVTEGRIPNDAMKWFSDAARRNIDAQWKTYQMTKGKGTLDYARSVKNYAQTLGSLGMSYNQYFNYAMQDVAGQAEKLVNLHLAQARGAELVAAHKMVATKFRETQLKFYRQYREGVRQDIEKRLGLDRKIVDLKVTVEEDNLDALFQAYADQHGKKVTELSQDERNLLTDNTQMAEMLHELKLRWLQMHRGGKGQIFSFWKTTFKSEDPLDKDDTSWFGFPFALGTEMAKRVGGSEASHNAFRIEELGKLFGRRLARRFDVGNIAQSEGEFYMARSVWPGLNFEQGVSRINWMATVLQLSTKETFKLLPRASQDMILSTVAQTFLKIDAVQSATTVGAINASTKVIDQISHLLDESNMSLASQTFKASLLPREAQKKSVIGKDLGWQLYRPGLKKNPILEAIMDRVVGVPQTSGREAHPDISPEEREKIRKRTWAGNKPLPAAIAEPPALTPLPPGTITEEVE